MSPKIESVEGDREAILSVARLMQTAARIAPKAAGRDDILTLVVYGAEKDAIADKMDEIAGQRKIDGFKGDAKSVRDSEAIVLIGVRGSRRMLSSFCFE